MYFAYQAAVVDADPLYYAFIQTHRLSLLFASYHVKNKQPLGATAKAATAPLTSDQITEQHIYPAQNYNPV
eukprot:scaffold360569_cov19-Prasinocladus_malaysianus.AAC.1